MIHFDVTAMQTELNSLEEQTLKSGFWNDGKKSGIILQNITSLKNKIQSYINLQKKLKELLEKARDVLDDDYSFLLINSYTTGISSISLQNILSLTFSNCSVETGEIELPIEENSLILPCGIYGRVPKN